MLFGCVLFCRALNAMGVGIGRAVDAEFEVIFFTSRPNIPIENRGDLTNLSNAAYNDLGLVLCNN